MRITPKEEDEILNHMEASIAYFSGRLTLFQAWIYFDILNTFK